MTDTEARDPRWTYGLCHQCGDPDTRIYMRTCAGPDDWCLSCYRAWVAAPPPVRFTGESVVI